MDTSFNKLTLPLIGVGIVALIAAGWGGLLRMGLQWPVLQATLPMSHGPLMVGGFLGTVIGVERAVALKRYRWTFFSPILTAAGTLLLLLGIGDAIGPLLITLGSVGLVAVFGLILRIHTADYTVAMASGSVLWMVGNVLWMLHWPLHTLVGWWSGFLLMTIAGERLELDRILRLSKQVLRYFTVASVIYVGGLVVSLFNLDSGTRLSGAGMLALALWLIRYDIARYTIKKEGITQFIAACLLVGYVWMVVSGALLIAFGGLIAGPYYDAMLHTFFIGFVISMIFGHAPIIFPAVLGVGFKFHRFFYTHLALLHIALAIRVAGDLLAWSLLREWGGFLIAIAILLFIFNTIVAVRMDRKK